MGKTCRRLGLGLALGAAAGHYLSTEKGQQLLTKVKKGLDAYQENPDYYQDQARAFFAEQVASLKDLVQEASREEADVMPPTSATVDDIIITYPAEDDA